MMDSVASFTFEASKSVESILEQRSKLAIIPFPNSEIQGQSIEESVTNDEKSQLNTEERRFVFVDSQGVVQDERRWLHRFKHPINIQNWQLACGNIQKSFGDEGHVTMQSTLEKDAGSGVALERVDFLGPAEAIKGLVELPYSDRPFSMALHRIGKTLIIDGNIEEPSAAKETAEQYAWASTPPQCLPTFQIEVPTPSIPECDMPEREHETPRNVPPGPLLFQPDTNPEGTILESSARPFFVPDAINNSWKMYEWSVEEMRLALSSNLLSCSAPEAGHPAVNVKVLNPGETLTQCTCLDYYLENVIANIPELALCLRSKGYIQSCKLVKTEEIPFIQAEGNIELDAPPMFDPKTVELNASMLLRFLQENCQQEGRTYILHRAASGGDVQLYDLTALSQERLRKWKWLLAMLCYRFALRISHYVHVVQLASRETLLHRQRKLLGTCLQLLQELACMGGGRHETICAAVQEHMADSYLAINGDGASPMSSPAKSPTATKDPASVPVSPEGFGHHMWDAPSLGVGSGCHSSASNGVSVSNLEQAKEHLVQGVAILRGLLETHTLTADAPTEEQEFLREEREDTESDAYEAVACQLVLLEEKLTTTCVTLARELLHAHNLPIETSEYLRVLGVLSQGMDHWLNTDYLQKKHHIAGEGDASEQVASRLVLTATLWELIAECLKTEHLFPKYMKASIRNKDRDAERNILTELCSFLTKAEAFRASLASAVDGMDLVSSIEWTQLDVCESIHSSSRVGKRQHNKKTDASKSSTKTLPCLRTQLNQVSNETGLAQALVYWKTQAACALAYQSAWLCRKQADFLKGHSDVSTQPLHLKYGDACNEVGKLISQYIKNCFQSNPQHALELGTVLPTCMATCITWFEFALEVFEELGCEGSVFAALVCLNLASVTKLKARMTVQLPEPPSELSAKPMRASKNSDPGLSLEEEWYTEAFELCTRGQTALQLRSESGPGTKVWDLLSEEAALTQLALGVHRKQALAKGAGLHNCGRREEKRIVEPLKSALQTYILLSNWSQVAAVNYQLGAFYMGIWKHQATLLKKEEYFNLAAEHFQCAHGFFSEKEKGATYLIVLLDMSQLQLDGPDSSPSAYISQLVQCLILLLDCDRINEGDHVEKLTPSSKIGKLLKKNLDQVSQVVHQILKFLKQMNSGPKKDYISEKFAFFRKLYAEIIGITKSYNDIALQGGAKASKFLLNQIIVIKTKFYVGLLEYKKVMA